MKKVLPKQIGDYRILEQIGEGWMWIVYLAEQEQPMRRRVELKIVKQATDTEEVAAAFESERQALALMNHSNIAKVYGSDMTADGRPFLVMEAVGGIPITEFCDKYKLHVSERLEMFVQTCHAIHHAHQKGIFHRDIKPPNVMVSKTDGKNIPKVIDFAIVETISQTLTDETRQTRHGDLIGTPEYMSPEQVASGGLDADTSSDVYSLGVLLYELLVGVLPIESHGLAVVRTQQAISGEDPPDLATRLNSMGDKAADIAAHRQTDLKTLTRDLNGDLAWITQKAMEKDRTRRYASASQLAADVVRYLNNEPIQARVPTIAYLLSKAVARYRMPIAVAAGFVVLLAGFAVAMAIQANRISVEAERANLEAQRASREAETALQVSAFMEDLFSVSDPNEARGNAITAREILDAGAERIETELGEQPVVQARLMLTMGKVYYGLGLYEQAVTLLEQSVALRTRELGEEHLDVSASLNALGRVRWRQGQRADAESLLKRALAIRERALGADHIDVGRNLDDLAVLYRSTARYQEAERVNLRALDIDEKAFGPNHPQTATSLNNLAALYTIMGRYVESENLHLLALDIREKVLGPDHPDVGRSLSTLALLYTHMGRYTEAETLNRRALAVREKSLGPDHPNVGVTLSNLGFLYESTGRYAEAVPVHLRALGIREQAFGSDHPSVAFSLMNLGNVHLKLGEYADAEQLLKRAIAIQEEALPVDHPLLARSLHGLANVYHGRGQAGDAESLYDRALAIFEMTYSNHPNVARTLADMAKLFTVQGRKQEAEAAYRKALSILEQTLGADHPDVPRTMMDYAALLRELNRNDEADEMQAHAVELLHDRT